MNKPEVTRAQLERVIGKLFDEIHATKRGLASVQRAQDTKHTVLLPGESIKQLGEDGRVTVEFGGNGGNAVKHVDGPTPNQPEAPEVSVQDGQFTVIVDGYDITGEPAPQDLARTIVHYSREDGFNAYQGTVKGTITGASGQKVFGVAAGVWYVRVQWETLAGKLSDPSEPVMVEVEPPVDAQDIQDTLDTAQARLDDYRDEVAAPRFEALETGLETNTTNLDDARTRLSAAEQTLSPLPGRIESAEQDVAAAQVEATKAAAAAVEANNRAMTRLANGNFESGLDYWDHDNVALTSTAHSGQQAAQIDGWLRPGSSFPVVADQIWELSLYHQYDVTVEFQAIDGDTRTTLSTHHLDGDSTWSDSGALRVTIPADVHMLSFTITGTGAIVDDITLRDVTDVVRLEEAATANRQKAEQAISELAVLQLAVDGEGGLKDRLTTAETVLETKADTSALDQLDQKLAGDLAAFEAHYTRVWRQPTPPPPGTHYAWLGERGEGMSVRLDGDGNELARNLIAYGEKPSNPATSADIIRYDDDGYLQVADSINSNIRYVAFTRNNTVYMPEFPAPGETFTVTFEVKSSNGRGEVQLHIGNNQGGYHVATGQMGTEFSTFSLTREWAADGERPWQPHFNFRGDEPGVLFTLRHVKVEIGDQVVAYWDGDTVSDRANDLWYNSDGVPHEWVNGNGWVELSDARITELTNTVSAHATRLQTAETGLEEALEGPIDHDRLRVGTGAFDEAFASKLIADHATIINAAMRNLSVSEKLLFAEAIGEQIWAELGVFDRLQAREGWIGGTLLADGAVTAEKITATRELITKIMGAEWAYISERLVVDGDLIANHADVISAAIQSLSVTERADLFEAFITTLGAQEAVIDLLIGTEAWIGGTMLKDDTVTTRHIEFTETLVGNIAELLHLVVDRIDVNSLWADQTWQNEAHFGSEDADQSSRIDATQLRFTKHNHETETSTDIVRLGGEGIGLTFADADTGETTGSLSPEGNASLQNVDTEHLTVDGRPLTTPESTQYVHPSGDQSLMSWMPRGVVARGSRVLDGGATNYRQYGVLEVAATLHAGRSYWITVPPFFVRGGAGTTNYTVLSYTTDGTPPRWDSPEIMRDRRIISGWQNDVEHSAHALFTPTETAHHRILLSIYGANGVERFTNMPIHMVIEDAGKAVPDGTVVRETYWDHPSGSSPILGAIRSNNTTTTEWALDWYQNYSHGGTRRASHGTASGGNSGGYGSGALTQGARPNRLSSEGIYHSLFGFAGATHSSDPAELGKTIQTALAGVDIQSILLVARSHTAHSTSNRTDYGIEATPYATAPNQYTDAHWWVGTYGTSPGHHIHASIPADEYGPLLKSGDIQTFGLRTSSTNLRQSGMLYATIGDTPPRLIISYQKEQDGS